MNKKMVSMNKKMVSMIFDPGSNMHFHVTYRSYTDGRPWGDKCSLQSFVFEINDVYAVYKHNNSNYELSEGDILNIQNLVLSENYYISSLKLVITYSEPPESNLIPDINIEASSLADEVVIGAFGGILIKELGQSSFFSKSCYSSYSKDRTITHYLDTILEYRDIKTLLRLDCSNSVLNFSRSRLIEKVRSIVNNDYLVKLFSSFCNAPIIDIWGRDLSMNTGVPPLPFIEDVLFNIYMDEIDREIEKRLPKLKYARYQDEILIPIFDEEKEQSYCEVLNDIIINECNLLAPILGRAVRGGESIPFSGGTILINNEGKSKVKLEYG